MIEERVAALRAFNRFHTRWAGAFEANLHGTSWSLPEARVIYELGSGVGAVAELRSTLGMDAGYLSRLLARLEAAGAISRGKVDGDARRQSVELTATGRKAFRELEDEARALGRFVLDRLNEAEQVDLVDAMGRVRTLLGDERAGMRTVVLRGPRAGELGWILMRHGDLYQREYGWGFGFEALCAKVLADFAADHDAAREACWIAEVDGAPAGSILCVADDRSTARIRLLLVEPSARGLGVGTRLVEECVAFARRAGYGRLVLWTNAPLTSARRIYDRLGFVQTHEEEHTLFGGRPVLGQTLELEL